MFLGPQNKKPRVLYSLVADIYELSRYRSPRVARMATAQCHAPCTTTRGFRRPAPSFMHLRSHSLLLLEDKHYVLDIPIRLPWAALALSPSLGPDDVK